MPYQVIVVGTDGSERAGVAVSEALNLAKVSGAKVHAVNAVHPAVEAGYVESKAGQLTIDSARQVMEQVRSQLQAEADRLGVTMEIHNPGNGDAADALLQTAETLGADLIVVGNRGMSGVTRFVMGSVPNKISHNATCSVLIVNTDRS